MAAAADGSLYFSDWVERSYQLHGEGRIWRLIPSVEAIEGGAPTRAEAVSSALPDPFREVKAIGEKSKQTTGIEERLGFSSPRTVEWLAEHRLRGTPLTAELIRPAIASRDWETRLYAVRWIADERRTEFRDDVARLLEEPPPNERYYLAILAAAAMLSAEHDSNSHAAVDALLLSELRNNRRSPPQKAMALRMISPDWPELTLDMLEGFLRSESLPLRREAVRTLAMKNGAERDDVLRDVAADVNQSTELRADAIAGLAASAVANLELLQTLATSSERDVSREAQRALRTADPARLPEETKPAAEDLDAWLRLLEAPGDAASGRRLFNSAVGGRCSACHQHGGRGGVVGPDLTTIGQHREPRHLLQSILQPSAEIAPQYLPMMLVTRDGEVRVGLRAQEVTEGEERYDDFQGNRFTIATKDIESRSPSDVSIMPAGLEKLITIEDLRDLVAFLRGSLEQSN
jgi:putative heme-binding domain-containing protein